METKRCSWRADLKRFMIRFRRRAGSWEFSARLLRPLCDRCSTPGMRSRLAGTIGTELVGDHDPWRMLNFHHFALNGQALKSALTPTVPISASLSAIWANSHWFRSRRNNPIFLIVKHHTQYSERRAG